MEFEAIDPVEAYRRAVNPFRHDVIKAKGWPELFTGADGAYVTGADGRRYLDMLAQNGGATLGHRHPRVVEALTGVIRSGSPFLVPIGVPAASGLLAARLCDLAGADLERVYFCTGGSEAVENAMKFAMAATGRQGFVAFGEGFHGFTPGPLPLAGHDYWRRPVPHWTPEGRHRVPFGDVAALEKALAADDVAAVFVEPVQGLGGARVWDPQALREVADRCRAHGTLLICDEILTGIGRTGRWFGFQHAGVEPDLVVVSKGLSGGIAPVAAVLMTAQVHRSVYKSIASAYIHNSTFEGHLLGMTAGLTVLDVIEQEGVLEQAERTGALLRSRIEALAAEGLGVREVRGLGLLLGIRIEGLSAPDAPDGAAAVVDLMIERGVLLESAAHAQNWLRLTPPLTLSEESVEVFVTALRDSLLALDARG
ncbi:aspartate aminotransferase family protein [Streptomyces sp. SL13]|uniref:Aspartate aminotransferase family protein n=1 Tax=Streptantibioticus silvisoli TaxID=2705255 RepID=A0AA90H4E4_9ACTN|nr:aspartate aminotransferase family protein [Streptantibioticus silvisoli]MDI5966987.1 aspartate aminotransferase family protein [Streptantibioticus silvisoli]MDI5971056.1 aspartate aminotransferase family protein [Streptantibioticus silvisoli]